MALPINIEKLIHGDTVEWERIEFKAGWNPEEVVHTICAFVNDLHNWGGGYIVIGINEKDGRAELPPVGLNENSLDKIQKEIVNLGSQIQPNYFPIIQPYVLHGKHILVLWCPAGDNRMYTAPVTLGKKSQRQPYVRVGCKSIVAKGENLRQLSELTARIPFDDRVNNQATIDDFDLGLIQAYLHEVRSELYAESTKMLLPDLARAMYIAKGPDEDLRPVNVGLLFFSQKPEKFFPRSWIELVWHKDGSGQQFEELYFKGCLQKQLRNALNFIQANVITEKVIKQKGKAEALRFYNFPYEAIEEVLSNAVYHKSYERQSPVEVQVWPDKIEIISFPGPVPPVNDKVLKTKRRIIVRDYRNRRIGDFLKELQLTEGRGTGFPAIYEAMEDNGSPKPTFETDDDCTYFLAVIPAHPLADKTYTQSTPGTGEVLGLKTIEDIVRLANQFNQQAKVKVKSDVISSKNDQVEYQLRGGANDQVNEQKANPVDKNEAENPNLPNDQVNMQGNSEVNRKEEKQENLINDQVNDQVKSRAINTVKNDQVEYQLRGGANDQVNGQKANTVDKNEAEKPNLPNDQVNMQGNSEVNRKEEKQENLMNDQVESAVISAKNDQVEYQLRGGANDQVNGQKANTVDENEAENPNLPNDQVNMQENSEVNRKEEKQENLMNDQVNDQVKTSDDLPEDVIKQIKTILNKDVHNRVPEILTLLQKKTPRAVLFKKMRLKNHSDNRERYLDPLLELGWVEREFPKKTNPKQTYIITESGKMILALLNKLKSQL